MKPNGPIGGMWRQVSADRKRGRCPVRLSPSRISIMVESSKRLSWKDVLKERLWVEKMPFDLHIKYGTQREWFLRKEDLVTMRLCWLGMPI